MTARRALVLSLAVACSGPAEPPPQTPTRPLPPCPPPWTGVADLHVDLPYQVAFRDRSVDLDQPGVDVTAASLREGNVRLLVLSLYVPSKRRDTGFDDLLAVLDTAEQIVATNQQLFDQLEAEVVFVVEGSRALVGQAHRIPSLISRRVVLFGLTHKYHNALADSAQDHSSGSGGLSQQGREFVRAVYRAGGIIDVSHASDDTVRDAVEIALAENGVVIATHSNARAIADHERNLSDELLRAIASTKGVVGLNFHSRFLRRRGRTTIADIVAHATHMIDVMGAKHVAIGSDFDGSIRPPRDLRTHASLPALAKALHDSGLSNEHVAGIMGRNAVEVILRPERPTRCAGVRESP